MQDTLKMSRNPPGMMDRLGVKVKIPIATLKCQSGDFPGGSVVKILCFSGRENKFHSCSEN